MNRLAGLETEYGCLAPPALQPPTIPERVRDFVFHELRLGLIDVHYRDYDEPAGNGGFLFNGGRIYLDMGHVEFCTPECLDLADIAAYDHAGELILQQALDGLAVSKEVSFIKNNVDHFTGATFGCHENYLVRRDAPLSQENVDSLLGFLALRTLLVGAGRVGAAAGAQRHSTRESGQWTPFQISQRADFIQTDVYEWVQFNRALINARDEPLADFRRFRRLHLLQGDSNMLVFCTALKVGATAMILDLLEANKMPAIVLADPVRSMRRLSRAPEGPWEVALDDGSVVPALEVLRRYWTILADGPVPLDDDARWVLQAWKWVMDTFESGDRQRLVGRVDWVTKHFLLKAFVESEGVAWDDPWMASLDLEFHNINMQRGLAATFPDTDLAAIGLRKQPARDYLLEPPPNTRANIRSKAMRQIQGSATQYLIDWDSVQADTGFTLELDDPFRFE